MRIQPAPRIIAVAALCAAALVVLVVSEGIARDAGQEALLPIEAVDPRSLLQGHYVQLNLTQRLDQGQACPVAEDGADWIAFHRSADGVLTLAGGALSRDSARQIAPVSVKGTFTCIEPTPAADGAPGTAGLAQFDLGIDRFHINQAEALRIEQVLRDQRPDEETRAFALLSIGRDGRARLKGLIIDDERLELSWL